VGSDLESANDSRRDFLKKSAAVGAAVWAAPTVLSLPGGRAWAQQYPVCDCNAAAYGLRVIIPALNIDSMFGVGGCIADTGNIGGSGIATVRAQVVCGESSSSTNGVCSSDANVDKVSIIAASSAHPTLTVAATVLQSAAGGSCHPCATNGSASILGLKVNGTTIALSAPCNFHPLGLPTVTVNEQSCNGQTENVNALHVNVPGVVEVIVAHSEAGSTGCACTTC